MTSKNDPPKKAEDAKQEIQPVDPEPGRLLDVILRGFEAKTRSFTAEVDRLYHLHIEKAFPVELHRSAFASLSIHHDKKVSEVQAEFDRISKHYADLRAKQKG